MNSSMPQNHSVHTTPLSASSSRARGQMTTAPVACNISKSSVACSSSLPAEPAAFAGPLLHWPFLEAATNLSSARPGICALLSEIVAVAVLMEAGADTWSPPGTGGNDEELRGHRTVTPMACSSLKSSSA